MRGADLYFAFRARESGAMPLISVAYFILYKGSLYCLVNDYPWKVWDSFFSFQKVPWLGSIVQLCILVNIRCAAPLPSALPDYCVVVFRQ